jgi:two-component system chemotaxis response regulator CheV
MSGVMASVDQRTQLAGHNRLELLMFRLGGAQYYGINVFNVREVLPCPALSSVPQSHPVVLAEVTGTKEGLSQNILDQIERPVGGKDMILVVDDSLVARKQVCKTIENNMALETVIGKDGKQAIYLLKQWADTQDQTLDRLALVISDIEMPEMDGYTFTTEIRADERLKHLYIILDTSMSGVFNQTMVDKVGADKFIAKFDGDILAQAVINVMKDLAAGQQ